jgi:hypothetical protein
VAHRGRKSADDLLVLALATGATGDEAAQAAGVSPRTVARRVNDHALMSRVAALRSEMVSRACGRLADAMAAAADVLRRLLASADEGVQIRAARAVLELGLKAREAEEIEARVRELEERVAEVVGGLTRATGTHGPAAAPRPYRADGG